MRHVAFSMLSAGVFRATRSLDAVLQIAVRELQKHQLQWSATAILKRTSHELAGAREHHHAVSEPNLCTLELGHG